MTISESMLQPVVALVLWSMVIWSWMFATRIPAIIKMKMRMDATRPRGEQMSELPANVRWKADNYNNLMEQPTIFYALAITLAVIGAASTLNLVLAWVYVGLRVLHSLEHVTVNKVERRFVLFLISGFVLWAMAISAAVQIFL